MVSVFWGLRVGRVSKSGTLASSLSFPAGERASKSIAGITGSRMSDDVGEGRNSGSFSVGDRIIEGITVFGLRIPFVTGASGISTGISVLPEASAFVTAFEVEAELGIAEGKGGRVVTMGVETWTFSRFAAGGPDVGTPGGFTIWGDCAVPATGPSFLVGFSPCNRSGSIDIWVWSVLGWLIPAPCCICARMSVLRAESPSCESGVLACAGAEGVARRGGKIGWVTGVDNGWAADRVDEGGAVGTTVGVSGVAENSVETPDVEAGGWVADGAYDGTHVACAVSFAAKSGACRFGSGSLMVEDTSVLGRFKALRRSRARCVLSACLGVRMGEPARFGAPTPDGLAGGECRTAAAEDDNCEVMSIGGAGDGALVCIEGWLLFIEESPVTPTVKDAVAGYFVYRIQKKIRVM